MHAIGRSFIETVAQEWYVLAAYFGMFVLLEVRRRGERVAMHRVTRHAIWAAATIVVAHALMAAATMIRRQGVDFIVIDYVLVMVLTGSILFLLGRMFEEVPEPAFASVAAEDETDEF
jgi:ABC-type xylose transport system permease subunit